MTCSSVGGDGHSTAERRPPREHDAADSSASAGGARLDGDAAEQALRVAAAAGGRQDTRDAAANGPEPRPRAVGSRVPCGRRGAARRQGTADAAADRDAHKGTGLPDGYFVPMYGTCRSSGLSFRPNPK